MKLGLVAVVLICVGVFWATSWVTFKVNERRFNRRGVAGLQEFQSYQHAVVIRWTEWFVMVLARPTKWAAVGMGLSALFMLLR
jgi:glucose uptake protein GlcU